MRLQGSCHCGAVRFSVEANSPVPFMHCHCSVCRKTAGSGGYAINLGADAATLKVRGERHLGRYRALLREPGRRAQPVAGRAPLLQGMRQPALALGSALAGARPSACVGDRHAVAEAARGRRGGARFRGAVGRRAARQGPRARAPLARRVARGLAPAPSPLEPVTAARGARPRALSVAKRLPKIAVPMRTIVAPSSDRRLEVVAHAGRERVEREAVVAQRLQQRAQRAVRAALRLDVGGRRRESPSARAAAGAAAPRRRGASAGSIARRDAALRRFAADVDLQADRERRQRVGRCAHSRSASFRRSSEWTQSKCSATRRVLLLCSGPIRCHSSRGASARSAAILASASCT